MRDLHRRRTRTGRMASPECHGHTCVAMPNRHRLDPHAHGKRGHGTLQRGSTGPLGRIIALCGMLAVLAGCRSDSWRFAETGVFAEPIEPLAASPPRGEIETGVPTVIRGQFSPDAGRSVPSLYPSEPSRGASGSFLPARDDDATAASDPNRVSSGQLAPVSPAYGQASSASGGPSRQTVMQGGSYPVHPRDAENPAHGVLDDLAPVGNDPRWDDPTRYIPLTPMLQETTTGRMMFGVGVNSDAGLVGSIIVDEQNFNWKKFPRGWEDIRNATAWRGAGQHFRLEAVPGTELQRYVVSFQEPYLAGSEVSLGTSFNYYTRRYREWDEERLGGRVAIGYHFNHALTGTLAYRGERVDLFHPIEPTPRDLQDALGKSALHGFEARLSHDTRDSPYLATEGHLVEVSFEQVIGTYMYPRFEVDARKYFLLGQRPDGSGRHVLSLNARMGWTDSDTPIYEHYFAGGFSTIRGFDFRGASAKDPATNVIVGGHFELLASAEYLFPITADDMLRGVVFCDTGTVQPSIDDWRDKYRVSPGFGLRIVIPAMGPAPIALDFAFPAVLNPGDRIENFSFFVGFLR